MRWNLSIDIVGTMYLQLQGHLTMVGILIIYTHIRNWCISLVTACLTPFKIPENPMFDLLAVSWDILSFFKTEVEITRQVVQRQEQSLGWLLGCLASSIACLLPNTYVHLSGSQCCLVHSAMWRLGCFLSFPTHQFSASGSRGTSNHWSCGEGLQHSTFF